MTDPHDCCGIVSTEDANHPYSSSERFSARHGESVVNQIRSMGGDARSSCKQTRALNVTARFLQLADVIEYPTSTLTTCDTASMGDAVLSEL